MMEMQGRWNGWRQCWWSGWNEQSRSVWSRWNERGRSITSKWSRWNGQSRRGIWKAQSRCGYRVRWQAGLERTGFAALTLVLMMFIACLLEGIVTIRTDVSARDIEGYYQEKEQELVADTREFLDRRGFSDSGVMLTRVVDTDGSRQYTLTVHHGRIDRMCEEDRQALMEEFEKIVFEDADSVFLHKFYVNQ